MDRYAQSLGEACQAKYWQWNGRVMREAQMEDTGGMDKQTGWKADGGHFWCTHGAPEEVSVSPRVPEGTL